MGDGSIGRALEVDVSLAPEVPRVDFRALFEREAAFVLRSLRRLGVLEKDLEDLVHEVFLSVYQKLGTYDPARPIRPWLFAFAFRAASHYRRRARRETDLEGVAEPPCPREAADDLLERDAKRRLLLDALDHLDLDRRAVFIMHELDDVPCPEIARALAIPLGTVYSRLRLAREDLESTVRRLKAQRGWS